MWCFRWFTYKSYLSVIKQELKAFSCLGLTKNIGYHSLNLGYLWVTLASETSLEKSKSGFGIMGQINSPINSLNTLVLWWSERALYWPLMMPSNASLSDSYTYDVCLFSFRFSTKWKSIWFKIERKTVTTIISHSIWKEMKI